MSTCFDSANAGFSTFSIICATRTFLGGIETRATARVTFASQRRPNI